MEIQNFHYPNKPIGSLSALAKALNLTPEELTHFVSNSHLYYFLHEEKIKSDGSKRTIYDTKKVFKAVLRRVNKNILNHIDMPDFVVAGRAGVGYIDNARRHLSSKMILSEDITNFFPSIKKERVIQIFQHLCCFPLDVSEALAQLCTFNGVLPQGSPVSGNIANLVFFNEEAKIVSEISGKSDIVYTRYYDDIHISSKSYYFNKSVPWFRSRLYGMFERVGLSVNQNKSNVMYSNFRVSVHDVTVNSHKLSPAKQRVSLVRLDIYNFRQLAQQNNASIEELVKKYLSIAGRIRTLKAQGYVKYEKMLKELNGIVTTIDEVAAKKYVRALRKVKTEKSFRKLRARVSVLKKINGKLSAIVDSEARQANVRVKGKNKIRVR